MADEIPDWAQDVPAWAQDKPTPPPDDPSWGEVAAGAAKNFIPSAGGVVGGIASTIRHPITAAENVGSLIGGEAQLAGKAAGVDLGESYIPTAEAVNHFYKDRYGGISNFKRAMRDDPAGVMMDASTVFGAPEMAFGRLPGVVGRASRIAGDAARNLNPLNPLRIPGRIAEASRMGDANAVGELSRAGVDMTPGSMAGGIGKHVEDAATSIPIVGSIIKGGKQRSLESFNTAVGNQVLEPIGREVAPGTRAGHDLFNHVEDQLHDHYDQILPNIQMRPDMGLLNDLRSLRRQPNGIASATAPMQAQYDNLLHNLMFRPNAWIWTRQPNGSLRPQINGQMFKTIESDLKSNANSYRSGTPDEQKMARALDGATEALQNNLMRQNPQQATALRNVNTSWAMFARMRDAAAKPGAAEGVFTPNHLLQAIRSGDRSVGKGVFARGDGLMQPLAEAGQRVLPSKIPDSGTPLRQLTAGALALFGGEQAAEHLPFLLHHPVGLGAAAGIVGGTAAAYSRPGTRVLNAAQRNIPRIPRGAVRTPVGVPRIVVNALPPDQRQPDNPYGQPPP